MDTENKTTEQLSGGEKKAREYADRVIDKNETYESVVQGLGPAMIASINAAIERRGYDVPTSQRSPEIKDPAIDNDSLESEVITLEQYGVEMAANRSEVVQNLYQDLLANKNDPEKRVALAKALIGDTYKKLRTTDYGINPEEQQVWESVQKSSVVSVKVQNDWMYRGVFPQNGQETVTRGSFNVRVTPELVQSLDTYIASGKVKANYKFGTPQTSASPQERHDAISIYFLEQPSDEVLNDLAAITKPFVRGNDLLGTKVAEGFYMSDVGSVKDEHISMLVESLESIDPSFAKAVKNDTTSWNGRIGMSEAQFYALKKVAEVFGYEIDYDTEEVFPFQFANFKQLPMFVTKPTPYRILFPCLPLSTSPMALCHSLRKEMNFLCSWSTKLVAVATAFGRCQKGIQKQGSRPRKQRVGSSKKRQEFWQFVLQSVHSFSMHYQFTFEGNTIDKTVTFFLGYVDSLKTVISQPQEIAALGWFSKAEALEKVSHAEVRRILEDAFAVAG